MQDDGLHEQEITPCHRDVGVFGEGVELRCGPHLRYRHGCPQCRQLAVPRVCAGLAVCRVPAWTIVPAAGRAAYLNMTDRDGDIFERYVCQPTNADVNPSVSVTTYTVD